MREGAGRNGHEHLERPISSEESGRRPIRARAAARRVGCRWAACVAGEECLGPSRPPRCFPRAPHCDPGSRRENTEEAGAGCPPGSHPGPRPLPAAVTGHLLKGDPSSAAAAERHDRLGLDQLGGSAGARRDREDSFLSLSRAPGWRHVPAEAGESRGRGGSGGGGRRGAAGRWPARPAGQSVPLRDGPARAPRAADRAALRPPVLGECAARPPGPPVAPAAGPRWPCLGRDGGGCGLRLGRGADQGGGAAEVGPGARSLLSGRGAGGGGWRCSRA